MHTLYVSCQNKIGLEEYLYDYVLLEPVKGYTFDI